MLECATLRELVSAASDAAAHGDDMYLNSRYGDSSQGEPPAASPSSAGPFIDNRRSRRSRDSWSPSLSQAWRHSRYCGSRSNKSKLRTPRTLTRLMQQHRDNERHRHRGLNASITDISKGIPGFDETTNETKIVKLQRIINYICHLEGHIKTLCLDVGVGLDYKNLFLSPHIAQPESRRGGGGIRVATMTTTSDQDDREDLMSTQKPEESRRRLKVSSPTIDSTTSDTSAVDVVDEEVTRQGYHLTTSEVPGPDCLSDILMEDHDSPLEDFPPSPSLHTMDLMADVQNQFLDDEDESDLFKDCENSWGSEREGSLLLDDQTVYTIHSYAKGPSTTSPLTTLLHDNTTLCDEASAENAEALYRTTDDQQLPVQYEVELLTTPPSPNHPTETFTPVADQYEVFTSPASVTASENNPAEFVIGQTVEVPCTSQPVVTLNTSLPDMAKSTSTPKDMLYIVTSPDWSDASPYLTSSTASLGVTPSPYKNLLSPSTDPLVSHMPYRWQFHQVNEKGKTVKSDLAESRPQEQIIIFKSCKETTRDAEQSTSSDDEENPLVVATDAQWLDTSECSDELDQLNKTKVDHRKTSWMNGFMMFSRIHRKSYIQLHPGVHTSHISKLMGQDWRKLSTEEQQPYKDKARLYVEHILRPQNET